jgi:hypothetical protein
MATFIRRQIDDCELVRPWAGGAVRATRGLVAGRWLVLGRVATAADLLGSTAAVCTTGDVVFLRARGDIGAALAGALNVLGSGGISFCRSGLAELTVAARAGARCPAGSRHVGSEFTAAERLGCELGECQPATGGVAATATTLIAQLAARQKTTWELQTDEKIRRGNIGRSLGEA